MLRKVVACVNVSLDGVMQAPGRADEDRRNGFPHGGWAASYAAMAHVGEVFGAADALLLGRRTYEDFYSVWPKRTDSPFTPWLNAIRKYVVTRTLTEPLPWQNSALLNGDAPVAVQALKTEPGKNILILGSGLLIRSLLGTPAIDELLLLIHPLMLGSGTRLFPEDGTRVPLSLASSTATPTGVVVVTYRPAQSEVTAH